MTNEKLTDRFTDLTMNPEKKEKVLHLFKSFREIDAAIEPFQEQRKELRSHYVENEFLSNEEFSLAKKAYNMLKKGISVEDLEVFVEAGRGAFPDAGA